MARAGAPWRDLPETFGNWNYHPRLAASLVVARKTLTIVVRIYAKLAQECPAHLFRIAKTRLVRHDANRQF